MLYNANNNYAFWNEVVQTKLVIIAMTQLSFQMQASFHCKNIHQVSKGGVSMFFSTLTIIIKFLLLLLAILVS